MGFQGFRTRQVVTAALVANALRPLPGLRVGIGSFVAGLLTGELAPHVLAVTAADATGHALGHRRRRLDPVGLALAGLSSAGLSYLIAQARRSGDLAEEALAEALGADYQDALDHRPTPAELAVPWRRLVNPLRIRDQRVHVERDIGYAPWGSRGRLDVYAPAAGVPEGGAPVLLQVHGGAWVLGRKEQQGIPLMQQMAARGWVCVALNYRLAPRDAWPAQVVDVKRALAWVQQNIAAYGGDPSYVAITGGSAGGHLCSLAALTPGDPAYQPGFEDADTSVACCVPHYGVYDVAGATGLPRVLQMRDRFLAPRVMQQRYADAPEVFEAATPILRITPDAPDFFVLHGTSDSIVPVAQARRFVERLRAVSRATVVYAELPGTQHAFDVLPSIRSSHVVHAIDRYLHWHWSTWRQGRDHAEAAPNA